MRERRSIGPDHLLELRAAVAAAIPAAYRPAAAILGRILVASAEPGAPAADGASVPPPAPPEAEGASAPPPVSSPPEAADAGAARPPATASTAPPTPPTTSPTLERLIAALRGELDRAGGGAPPRRAARRDPRIPIVPLVPVELPEE